MSHNGPSRESRGMRELFYDNNWRRYSLVAALTLAYYLVPWTSLQPAALIAGLPFLLFYTVVLPGAALSRFFPSPDLDVFESVTVWFFNGLLVLLACCFAWALSGLSLTFFKNALPAVLVPLVLLLGYKRPAHAAAHAAGRGGRLLPVLFGLLLGVIFILLLSSGAAVDYSKDSPDHIGYVNEIARTGEPFPITAIYKDPGANGDDLRKGLLHAVYGFYKAFLGADTVDLFTGINSFWSILLLLAVYTAANRLFRNRAVAVLSSLLFLLGFEEGIRNYFIRTTFFPNRFALGFLLLFLSAALGYLERRERWLLAAGAVYAFAAAAVHIQYVVLLAAAVLSIGIWKTCFEAAGYRAHLLRFLYIGLTAFAGLLPYAAYRYFTAYQASDLHQQVQGMVFLTDSLFVADPPQIFVSVGLIGIASVVCIIPMWKRRRESAGLGYLIASTLTILVTVFNPLVLPVLYKVVTYLVLRLVWICPFYVLAAYTLVDFVNRGPRRGLRGVVFALLVLAIAVDVSSVFRHNTFSPGTLEAERRYSHLYWEDGLERMRVMLPERSVVASDPITSYTVDAFTPHYVVSTFDQHAPPNDLLVRERTTASRDILNPYSSAAHKAELIEKFGVTHVVVNGRLEGGLTVDYWMTNARSVPLIRERMFELTDLFEVVSDERGFLILRCTGASPSGTVPARVSALERGLPPNARPVGKPAGKARLEAVLLDESRSYQNGDTVDVTLYWSRSERLPLDKYVVTIRFDRTDNRARFGDKTFSKLARKIKERTAGERYRFRADHKILNGFFDPDLWPEGFYVADETSVAVPADAAEGNYTVRAILLTRPTMPNVRLRDLLYDDDVYHGVEIGEITIAPPD